MPAPLLKDKSINDMEVEEFIELLAQARYLQEREEYIMACAIARVFSEEE